MTKTIRLKIEQLEENGEVYYLATSNDVQGLVAQGATLEEAKEIALDLIRLIQELDEEWKNQPLPPKPNVVEMEICI